MSAVPFQILSDLHLETHTSYNYPVKQTAPNLALLGDIGHVAHEDLFVFLEKQLRRYWNVFFLLGNHEPVSSSWPAAKARVHAFAERMEQLRIRSTMGRFVFLDQTRHDVSDTLTILGCTLYSRISPEQMGAVGSRFIDFEKIQNWTVDNHIDAHISDLQWLNAQVSEISKSEPQRQIAIFTHHCPTPDARSTDGRHANSPVESGFVTDLGAEECWRNESVVLWAFGHTHSSCDFVDDLGKNVVANQKGYAMALEEAFKIKKVFFVGKDTKPAAAGGLI